MVIINAKDYKDMSRKAANIISAVIILKPNCVLGLATGSTPIGTYQQLAEWYQKGDLDFSRVSAVNLDEYRGIAADDPNSYRYFMYEQFFRFINISPKNMHIPDGSDSDSERVCATYDEQIKNLGGIDIQLLGLGLNGHIGFNEPGVAFDMGTHCVNLDETTIEANKRFFSDASLVPRQAYTMGIKSIMQARKILVIVNGREKAEVVKRAFCGPVTPGVPASILQLHPDCTVITDELAACLLTR